MKDNSEDSPFDEEMVGSPTPSGAESEAPATPETPAEPSRPVDKTIRLEAEMMYLRDRAEASEAALVGMRQRFGRLIIAGLLLFVVFGIAIVHLAHLTDARFEDLKSSPKEPATSHPIRVSSVSFVHWSQGQPAIKLIKRDEGLCFLTEVGGHFEGGGEAVRVSVEKDGYWYLGGSSYQNGVIATCAVLRY